MATGAAIALLEDAAVGSDHEVAVAGGTTPRCLPMTAAVRPCRERDFDTLLAIVNDAAVAYRGVIPADRWSDPYMPAEELAGEVRSGVEFWGFEDGGRLVGVMGLQEVDDVVLIRHAYVRTAHQGRGIGSRLLEALAARTTAPLLVGTWADAA